MINLYADRFGRAAHDGVHTLDGHAGQLTMSFVSGQTLVQVDVDMTRPPT